MSSIYNLLFFEWYILKKKNVTLLKNDSWEREREREREEFEFIIIIKVRNKRKSEDNINKKLNVPIFIISIKKIFKVTFHLIIFLLPIIDSWNIL